MAMNINNIPTIIENDLFTSRYNNARQIAVAENRIAQIDRKITAHEKNISITKELIEHNNYRMSLMKKIVNNNDKLIQATKESRDILQSSRDILQESRDTGQKIVDITEKLITCYERLLEIRRAKNDSNSLNMKQVSPLNVPNVPITLKDNVKPTNNFKNVDIQSVNATATKELGNILYDKYKDIHQTIALNIRTKFFEALNYNSNSHVFLDGSNINHLETIFATFSNYLKTGEYSYLKSGKDYFNDLQSKLISLDKHC